MCSPSTPLSPKFAHMKRKICVSRDGDRIGADITTNGHDCVGVDFENPMQARVVFLHGVALRRRCVSVTKVPVSSRENTETT